MLYSENESQTSWKASVIELVILLAIVLFIRFYLFQFFRVSGPSMCNTLNYLNETCEYGKGEFIFVNQILYLIREPAIGEVVVFRPPSKNTYYVKRVIGVPGDKVEVRDGAVYRNDKALNESYLSPRNQGQTKTYGQTVFEVPEGKYLLFGDNRAKSLDARQCFNSGCYSQEDDPFTLSNKIKGKAEFVVWPFWSTGNQGNTGFRFLKNPLDPEKVSD